MEEPQGHLAGKETASNKRSRKRLGVADYLLLKNVCSRHIEYRCFQRGVCEERYLEQYGSLVIPHEGFSCKVVDIRA